jgi:transposase-like protein/IS1 family transposase
MYMETQAKTSTKILCTKCGYACAKAGKRPDGMQRYCCMSCGKTTSERKEQTNVFQTKQAIDDSKALLALQLLVEGNSIRSTERITKLHRDTIMSLLLKAGERCTALLANVVRNVPATDVQADEIWSYVGKKESNKGHGDTREVGDAWTFIAIERNTKLVLAYQLGKRTVPSATRFIDKLALATDPNQRFQLTTDGMPSYAYPVGNILGDRVD